MTVYRVWAPAADRVEIQVGGTPHRMAPDDGDWWVADLPEAGTGADYSFRLDGGDWLPDPRSPWQPAGVSGPSRGYDHGAFTWSDGGWRGIPLAGSVIYELHVGTFTPGGTFDAAIERLDHLTSLGVDAVELMPVAAFPGERGWGYDGIGLWAVHEPYGGPDGLKRFAMPATPAGWRYCSTWSITTWASATGWVTSGRTSPRRTPRRGARR